MRANRLIMWVVAAVGAIVITSAAVTVANASGNDDVLSQDDVSRELAAEPSAAPTTPSGPVPTVMPSTPVGVARTLVLTSGWIVATCDGDRIWLSSWSPHPGYRVDDVRRGPGTSASLWFESDTADDVLVVVECENGLPTAVERPEFDDHGGDDRHGDDDRHGGDDDDDDDDDYDDSSGSGG